MIFKTKKEINENDYPDFTKERWGTKTYRYVEHYDPSCLAWMGGFSFWIENDAIEEAVEKETGVPPDEQLFLDKMPEVAHDGWIEFAKKIAGITDTEIEGALPDVLARMPDWQTKEKDAWKMYFTMKRDYMKALVEAGIERVEVYI